MTNVDKIMADSRIEAAVRCAIAQVNGLWVKWYNVFSTKTTDNQDMLLVNISVRGWSPSLHGIEMGWKATISAHDTDKANSVMATLTRQMDVQRTRAAMGITLGTAVPFGDVADNQAATDHILMDAGLAELACRSNVGGATLARIVGRAIHDLHTNAHNGLDNCIANDDWIEDRVYAQLERVGEDTWFHGDRLWIASENLPEIVQTAAIGRRLGDLVAVPSCLTEHIVKHIEPADGEGTDILVEPRLETIKVLDERRKAEKWAPRRQVKKT